MKIALYVPAWPAGFSPNGIVTYASYLVPALRELGHEVFVLTPAATKTTDLHTIELKQYQINPRAQDRVMFKFAPEIAQHRLISSSITRAVRDLVKTRKIDVLEMEESFGWSHAISRSKLVPVIVRLHGPSFLMGQFDQPHDAGKISREGRAIQSATFITSCCADTLNAVRDYYKLALKESHVVPNPIDAAPKSETWHGETCNTDTLLFVGRFDKVKGGDVVLNTFRRLAPHYPALHLTFVGPDRGIQINDRVLSFEQFVREYIPDEFRSRIHFRGQLSHADLMALRTRHFITLVAARHDIQGYVMMEALSLGCPIVATAVGGIPEVIKHERNGLLVSAQNPDEMAAACKRLLDDRGLAARIGYQAWLDCRDSYSPRSIGQQMIAAYQEAISLERVFPR